MKISNGVNFQHKNLASGKWNEMPFLKQMANIGSEVERTMNWKEKKAEYSQLASDRMLELLDLTIGDKKNQRRGRLKELLRLREVLADYFYFDNVYNSNDEIWKKYFLAFNYAANNKN